MSDLLSNIAERSLTTEQAIRPRPLSVFEPLTAIAASGSLQLPKTEKDHLVPESVAMNTMSEAPDAMTSKDLPAEAFTKAMQDQRLSLSTVIADSHIAEPSPLEQLNRQEKHRSAVMQTPNEPVPSFEANASAAATISPAFEIRSKFPPPTAKGRDWSSQEPLVPDEESRVTGTPTKQILVKPEIERVEVKNFAAAQLPLQSRAHLHSREETTGGNNNESMQNEASAPTIHVTIGRIEVRATPAPIQKQSKPNAPVSMSLDEYLTKRNGGGR